MKQINKLEGQYTLAELCNIARELVKQKKYQECELLIRNSMSKYPHAAEPHNLFGVLLEMLGDHLSAMKHFRAAWALDPTYIPARHNLEHYGTFISKSKCAFDESDCPEEKRDNMYQIKNDSQGVGHFVRRD